jgi:cell division protein FtsQ
VIDSPARERIPVTPPPQRRLWPWVVGALVVAAGLVLHSPWLSVSEIEVVGASRADAVGRVAETGVGPGAILVWVNTGEIATAVREDPWVADVRVERVWPDRLVVEVAEREPALWIEGLEGWMLVASDGAVVDIAPRPGPGLLRAELAFPDRRPGEVPIEPAWAELVDMARTLPPELAARVTLTLVGTEVWAQVGDHPVRFGHPIDMADKARALDAVLAEELPPGSTIDVVSPRRPAVVPLPNPGSEVEG